MKKKRLGIPRATSILTLSDNLLNNCLPSKPAGGLRIAPNENYPRTENTYKLISKSIVGTNSTKPPGVTLDRIWP